MDVKILFKKTALNPKGGAVMAELNAGKNPADYEVVVAKNKMGIYELYLEKAEQACSMGTMISCFEINGTDETLSVPAKVDSVAAYNHEVSFKGIEDGKFVVYLTPLAEEEKAEEEKEITEYLEEIEDACNRSGRDLTDAVEAVQWAIDSKVAPEQIHFWISTWRPTPNAQKKPKTLYKITDKEVLLNGGVSIPYKILLYKSLGIDVIGAGEKASGKNTCMDTINWFQYVPGYLLTGGLDCTKETFHGIQKTKEVELFKRSDVPELAESYIQVTLARKLGADEVDAEMVEKAAEFERLRAEAASVNVVVDSTEFLDWLLDPNPYATFSMNEMNLLEANLMASIFNQILDNTGFVSIPGFGRIELPKSKAVVATQNEGDAYKGVRAQNDATMSRFVQVIFPLPDKVSPILRTATSEFVIGDNIFDVCDKFWAQAKGITMTACNTRGMIAALKAFASANGRIPITSILQDAVINTCPVKDRAALQSALMDCVAALGI